MLNLSQVVLAEINCFSAIFTIGKLDAGSHPRLTTQGPYAIG
jgi:hypothetical protein